MTKRMLGWAAGLTVLAAVIGGTVEPAAGQTKAKPKTAPAKSAPVLKPGKPSKHGLREADLESLRTILKDAVEKKTLPGVALLLAHKGEVIFKEAYGDLKVDRPVRIASDSKPVAATVVMAVVDQGKMRLDDTVTKFVPEFEGTKVENATVRQLLCHNSGIEDHFPRRRRTTTMAEFAAAVASHGSLQEPGKYRYSTVGIDVACRCAEKAAGRPFEELMREHLFDPLGMKQTEFARDGEAEAVPKEARDRGEGRFVSGGGGLSSSMDDMAAFYQMHLNGGRYGDKQILSRKAVAEMHRKQSVSPDRGNYGLGFFLDGPTRDGVARIFSHGGVHGTFCQTDGYRQLVSVLFSQAGMPKTLPVLIAIHKKLYELFPPG